MRRALVLLGILVLAGCASPEPPGPATATPVTSPTTPTASPSPPLPPPDSLQRGVALSPKSYGAEDFPRFFTQAKELGGLVLWGGQGDELADPKAAPTAIATLARQNGLLFAAQTDWQKEGVPFDAARQAKARADVVAFVEEHKPAYMILGVEVDRVQERDPAYFDAFVPWYDATYQELKRVAPDTLVFPSFQLERVSGHTGGIFGGPESSPPKWDLIERFPRRDLTGFTTYPGLVFAEVEDIPADYYALAAEKAGTAVAFTEMGHYARFTAAPAWESDDEEQAAFARHMLEAANDIDARLAVWLHLYDQPSAQFEWEQHLGLIAQDGTERPAYEVWRDA